MKSARGPSLTADTMEKADPASHLGCSSQRDVPIHFVSVNKVPTQVICFGDAQDATRPVVLVIPGNPGSIEFYTEFIREIFDGLKRKVTVWGVSHAGHVAPPKPMQIPNVEGRCSRGSIFQHSWKSPVPQGCTLLAMMMQYVYQKQKPLANLEPCGRWRRNKLYCSTQFRGGW